MRLEQEKTITALLTNDPALQPLEGELLRAHALLREAGLDVAVLGTALYRSADPREDISRIHALP